MLPIHFPNFDYFLVIRQVRSFMFKRCLVNNFMIFISSLSYSRISCSIYVFVIKCYRLLSQTARCFQFFEQEANFLYNYFNITTRCFVKLTFLSHKRYQLLSYAVCCFPQCFEQEASTIEIQFLIQPLV